MKQPILKKAGIILATGFGSGYLPLVPGTWGTGAALIIYFLLFYMLKIPTMPWLVLLALTCSCSGVWASFIGEEHFKRHDPGQVVIDEFAGFYVTMLLVAPTLPNMVIGFILFRIFDIWKPYPAYKLEKLPGGWGIMADDIAAGIYGMIILWALQYLPFFSS